MASSRLLTPQDESQMALFVVLGVALSVIPEPARSAACLGLLVFAGVPHGGLDAYLMWIEGKHPVRNFALKLLGYLGAVICAAALWWLDPEWFWICFLVAATVHFGLGDSAAENTGLSPNARWIFALQRGAIIVFAPLLSQDTMPYEVLAYVASTEMARILVNIAPVLVGIAMLPAIVCLLSQHFGRKDALLAQWKMTCQALFYLLLFALTPTLVAFTLYFVCAHSLSHMLRVLGQIKQRRRKYLVFLSGLIFSIPVYLVFLALQSATYDEPSVAALTGVVFVMIGALTFPHMVIVHRMPS